MFFRPVFVGRFCESRAFSAASSSGEYSWAFRYGFFPKRNGYSGQSEQGQALTSCAESPQQSRHFARIAFMGFIRFPPSQEHYSCSLWLKKISCTDFPKNRAIFTFTSSLGTLSPRSYIAQEDFVIPIACAVSSWLRLPLRSRRIFPAVMGSHPFIRALYVLYWDNTPLCYECQPETATNSAQI